jgi:CO/xanthine dehydrogenase FAD-binding subunit
MNLNTITEIKRPSSADEVEGWGDGYAWLAGGTWLFSQPQFNLDTLIDIEGFQWPSLQASPAGLDIAATCRIVELDSFKGAPEWTAAPLLRMCCRSFLASFKIWNAATVGGNVCMSLPAGPMISLTAALEGTCILLPRRSAPREVSVVDFVTGNHQNVLRPGELLRSIRLPARALAKKFAFRRSSLTHLGRSAVLLIGTQTRDTDDLLLTITAATIRPIQLRFERAPSGAELRDAIDAQVTEATYLDDVHGAPAYRRRLTYYYAEQIRLELVQPGPAI